MTPTTANTLAVEIVHLEVVRVFDGEAVRAFVRETIEKYGDLLEAFGDE